MSREQEIADLLNASNQLDKVHSAATIKNSRAMYYTITNERGRVVGAVALQRLRYLYTELRHLVLAPEMRGKGVGVRLVQHILTLATTPFVLATIREDNQASHKTLQRAGFRHVGILQKEDHQVYLYLYQKKDTFSFGQEDKGDIL